MYLDLDVLLAELKQDDWLASEVDLDEMNTPKTSVASGIEIQYAMEDEWSRSRLADAHQEIADTGVSLVPLTPSEMRSAAGLRQEYDELNVFDAVHLGTAAALDESIV